MVPKSRRLSGAHLEALYKACDFNDDLSWSSETTMCIVANWCEKTFREIQNALNGDDYPCVRVYRMPDGLNYVVGWHEGQWYAISPELGSTTAKGFQLSQRIIDAMKKKSTLKVVTKASKGARIAFSVVSVICFVFAAVSYGLVSEGTSGVIGAGVFIAVGLFCFTASYFLIPSNDKRVVARNKALIKQLAVA